MDQEPYDSPQHVVPDSSPMVDVKVMGCPYVGMFEDPQTTVAFPSAKNACHRLQTPVAVDLEHQSGFCLSSNYHDCYVYGEGEPLIETVKEESKSGVFLTPLVAGVSQIMSRRPAVLERFSLRTIDLKNLRSRLPFPKLTAIDLKSSLPDRSSFDSFYERINLDRFTLALSSLGELHERFDLRSLPLTQFDYQALAERTSVLFAGTKTRLTALDRQRLGFAALPLLLLLALLAAIAAWPTQDGAPQTPDVADIETIPDELLDDGSLEAIGSSASADQSSSPIAGGADGHRATNDALPETVIPERQDGTTEVSLASEDLVDDEHTQVVEASPIDLSEQTVDEQGTLLERDLTEIPGDESSGSDGDARAVETTAESDLSSEASMVNTPEESIARTAAVETNRENEAANLPSASDLLPAAMVTTIGPATADLSSAQEDDETAALYIYEAPTEDAQVFAVLAEQAVASILGRNTTGEWLRVRLGTDLEGWVIAADSGASVTVTDLPVIGEADSESQPDPLANPADSSDSEPLVGDDLSVVGSMSVNTGALNLRSGPGMDYESVGVVYNGQQVSLLSLPDEESLWVLVRTADGLQGWMNSRYMLQN